MPVTRSTSSRAHAVRASPSRDSAVQPPPAEEPSGTERIEETEKESRTTDTAATMTEQSTQATTTTAPEDATAHRKSKSAKTSKSQKALRLAKAREEMLTFQVKLAAARIARIQAEVEIEEEADDDSVEGSVISQQENARRIGTWLNDSPPHVLAITEQPHVPVDSPAEQHASSNQCPRHTPAAATPCNIAVPVARNIEDDNKGIVATRSANQVDISELASAIALAAKSGARPRYSMELPTYGGSHQEWLTFKRSYEASAPSFSETENMARLRNNLRGRAREAVENLLIFNTRPEEVMKALENRFGRPDSIALAEIERMRALPRLTDNPKDICIYASKVANIVASLRALQRTHYLYSPETTKNAVEKLTPALRYRWYDYTTEHSEEEPDLLKLSRFLDREADRCAPHAPPEIVAPEYSAATKSTARAYTASEKRSKCPVCSSDEHDIARCPKFTGVPVSERWDLAKSHKLCFACLRLRLRNHSCRRRKCETNGCEYSHHKLLHTKREEEQKNVEETTMSATVASVSGRTYRSYLKIVPVHISGPAGGTDTHALLDDGSTVTLIDAEIARKAGATGPKEPLRIEAIGECQLASSSSLRVSVTIRGPSASSFNIQARTMENMKLSPQVVKEKDLVGCDHLRDIEEHLRYERAEPRVLIGQDNWHLLLSSEVRSGRLDQPIASRTPLGWVMHGGGSRRYDQRTHVVNFIKDDDDDNLNEQLRKYVAVDSLFVEPKMPTNDPDSRAMEMLNKEIRQVAGKYEVPLLWKNEGCTMPDNYENTLRRLHSVEKKLDRNEELKQKYNDQMSALIKKGYAEIAPPVKSKRTWYLPHFAVVNPMKPGKIRIVHDAAAKTRGVSLNDHLLTGPDQLQSLPGVLMRFRQHPIAVSADIKEMFMQVKIKPEDRDALRYLWRGDCRDDRPPTEYRMTSLIFGATCSPSVAIFVKDYNAKKFEETHPDAVRTIINNHYVDDLLQSFRNEEEAIRIAKGVDMIQRTAGYELRQWTSNSSQVLQTLAPGADQHDVGLDIEKNTERVLGLQWNTASDNLGFNLNLARLPPGILEKPRPTKRETLKILMSLFDPLGLASPVIVRAKQILQDIWRRGSEWDVPIDEDLALQWTEWTIKLHELRNIAIPRCYSHYSDAVQIELHVFTDASEAAYAAVAYWRAITIDGSAHVSLVAARTKVAPLKLMSIPRLELQAAVMGARLAQTIAAEHHDIKIESITYWTDSKTTLTWIRTGSRSYRPFVAHRIAAIEELSSAAQWRWVPTKLNAADDATRNVPSDFGPQHRWYLGPPFLLEHSAAWPCDIHSTASNTGEERASCNTAAVKPSLLDAIPICYRFSKWEKLLRSTARVLQFIGKCKQKIEKVNFKRTKKNKEKDPSWSNTNKRPATKKTSRPSKSSAYVPLDSEYIEKAEDLLVRAVQLDAYGDAVSDIEKAQKGPLRKLSVVLCDGIIKIDSRIKATVDIPAELRQPAVLDGGHYITRLYVEYIHRRLNHSGVEATVNECRTRYWITRLRPITRAVVHRCLQCRRRKNLPPQPPTGDLPPCRLAHHTRPFSYTGLDYFGPLIVTVGRSQQKRYGALFTCLTTRAVHLEIAAGLTAESAVMALRRFIARRGCPTELWSDNGTNLHGADKELRESIDSATEEEANPRHIRWRYIPPGAPFMGGAWERLVRSVKTSLYAVLRERQPSEEVLATLLAEVEFCVNNRPLTHVSVSPADHEALTPNHFLLHGPALNPAPGTFSDADLVGRPTWRTAQRLADMFWDRWVREYLPELQHRREPHGRGPELRVGDVVLITDNTLPRNTWPLGLIITAFPGPDGVTRTVDVRTKGGVLRRPAKKLVLLSTEDRPS